MNSQLIEAGPITGEDTSDEEIDIMLGLPPPAEGYVKQRRFTPMEDPSPEHVWPESHYGPEVGG